MLQTDYLPEALEQFRKLRQLADRAMAQITDDDFFARPDGESNSIAVIMKHMAGNMRSRWTDFLTSDGEKPDRHREAEFLAKHFAADRWQSLSIPRGKSQEFNVAIHKKRP